MPETGAPVDLLRTARAIADLQLSSGAIPWGPGRHWDPWNHIEAAMGLSSAGLLAEADAAYECLAQTQRSDGSWAAAYVEDLVYDATVDANFCAYIACGVQHHYLTTGDDAFLTRMWPVVRRAVDRVLTMQLPDGSIGWAEDGAGNLWPQGLLTSSSCIFLALTSALALSSVIEEPAPEWELARKRLGEALSGSASFEDKSAFAMDWYYPVLGGAREGVDAAQLLAAGWTEFVAPNLGVRCMSGREWITTGETCELVLTCLRAGMVEEAARLYGWVQHLRDEDDGLYWTGANHPSGRVYPHEKTTWSAGSVLLAAATLRGDTATCTVFGIV